MFNRIFTRNKPVTPTVPPDTNVSVIETVETGGVRYDETGNKNKSNVDLKKELTDLVRDCGFRSSAHGLPSLTVDEVHNYIKIIWILVVLAGWSYFIYLITTIINDYNSHEVISSLKIGYEAPTNFPGNFKAALLLTKNFNFQFK
jgi:hypothetical protein